MHYTDNDARLRERERRTAADLQRLLRDLEPLPEPSSHPGLVAMVGLPGTGKSYFSRALADRVPAVIVESDAVRKTLFVQPTYGPNESYIVFLRAYALLEALVRRGVTVIFDATNLTERSRDYLYRIADTTGARLIIVRLHAPPEVVRERLELRRRDPSQRSDADWSVYEKMEPTQERIRRNHYVVDTAQDITGALERIVRELRHS